MKFISICVVATAAIKQFKVNEHCHEGNLVDVNYTGKLQDGTVFDSNLSRGSAPFNFALGAHKVIKCWEEGVALMAVGEKQTLTCPPEKAYGEKGAGDVIPPNATLTFDVELLGCGSKKVTLSEENEDENELPQISEDY